MSEIDTGLSIADEVERAISAGSPQKCSETVERVTALFLASAERYNDEQIALFGDIFERLINTIELRALADIGARIALAELSAQLATLPQVPASVIGRLARHEEIDIARPVLTESPRLSSDDLVEIARAGGEKHLIAIAGRWWLQEVVTDALLARRFPSVSRRLVDNPGAKMSPAGFAMIVAQAVGDPELAVVTGIRADLPKECGQGCCTARPTRCGPACCRARRPISSKRSVRPWPRHQAGRSGNCRGSATLRQRGSSSRSCGTTTR